MKNLTLSLSAAFVLSSSVFATDVAADPKAEVTKLVSAIASDDYAAFVADGNAALKALKKGQFEGVVSQLGSKLQGGYDLAYLGDLNQRGIRSPCGASASGQAEMTCLPR